MKRPCIGLVTPSATDNVPTTGVELYGERYNFIAKGVSIRGASPEGFAPVVDSVVQKAVELKEAGAEVISLMGTSLSFYRGHARAEELRQEMEQATGVPCTTISHAAVVALRHLGIRRVAIATAYIEELNDRLVEYLTYEGFTVTAIRGMSLTDGSKIRAVPTKALVDLSTEVFDRDRSADGVFISCAAFDSIDAIQQLESRLGLPVAASSPVGFWDVVRLGGWNASAVVGGRLFHGVSANA